MVCFWRVQRAIALSKNCEVIYYGAHADDAAGNAYPDCSSAFNDAMGQAIYLGSGNQVRIEAPFVNWTKAKVVGEGLRLKVPYDLRGVVMRVVTSLVVCVARVVTAQKPFAPMAFWIRHCTKGEAGELRSRY